MPRTLISDAKQQVGQQVTLGAWVQVIRHQGKIVFLVLRDISGSMQAVIFDKALVKAADGLTLESVVRVSGEIKPAEQAPDGIEIGVSELTVLSKAEAELPIPVIEKVPSQEEAAQEKRLDHRWIDLRKPEKQLIFKVWTTFEEAFREFWTQNGYLEIHSPKLMGAASEGGAEVFEVNYFDDKAYLAQSPQFYKQMAMASGFEKVFEVGPVFRAEPSFTTRHATEFTGFDFETSFIESHQDVIAEHQRLMVAVIEAVAKQHGAAIKAAFGRELTVPKAPFPQVTMAEAKAMLKQSGLKSDMPGDLSPEEERGLSELIAKEHGHEFVYVTDYPQAKRAFYHMRLEPGSELTRGFDLIWNGIEVTTGAQREHRPEVLESQAKERQIDIKELANYLDFFRHGCPPHGGVGMGPARMMTRLLNLPSIREVTFLHRGVKRLTP